MKNKNEKACLCALGKIFGFEPKTANAMIEHIGSARKIFELGKDELDEMLGPFSRHKGEIRPEAVEKAYEELDRLENIGIRYCGITEEEYPALLKECPDPPTGIYIRSETPDRELWKPARSIAIVGTRNVTPYGREWCQKTVYALAESKERPLIVSGLALGTDICAHRAALDAGLPTIGVMATGPEGIYPYRNRETAMQMTRTEGCALITDYPPGTAPLALHFLRRNRIIAGLAQATILIESKIRGGGMMTSRLAFSYSRDVYALPGRADDIYSQGCNELIRAKIAEPLTSTAVLLENLGMKSRHPRHRSDDREILMQTYGESLTPEAISLMAKLLELIRKEKGITLEELAASCGLPYHMVLKSCSMLESDGFITTDLLQRCSINAKSY